MSHNKRFRVCKFVIDHREPFSLEEIIAEAEKKFGKGIGIERLVREEVDVAFEAGVLEYTDDGKFIVREFV